jgi:hypothetical protein
MAKQLSIKGRDWHDNKLDEDTLKSGVLVVWRNKGYVTGNRYGDQVELYRDGRFIRTVSCNHVRLVNNSNERKPLVFKFRVPVTEGTIMENPLKLKTKTDGQ